MKHTDQPGAPQDPYQDWVAAAQGTITVATLIAGITIAAYVTIVSGQGNFTTLEEHDLWLVTISVAAFSTLVRYLFAVATGMEQYSPQTKSNAINASNWQQPHFISRFSPS